MNDRQIYNRLIIKRISGLVEKYPDWRFGQLLWNCGIIDWTNNVDGKVRDPYNDESSDIWLKMKKYENL